MEFFQNFGNSDLHTGPWKETLQGYFVFLFRNGVFFTSGQSLELQYARLLLSSCPENTGHPSSNAILSGNRNAWLESPIITIFFIAMLFFSLHKSCFAAPLLQLNAHIELPELPWIPITSPPSILKNVEYLLLLVQCTIVQATVPLMLFCNYWRSCFIVPGCH